MNAPLSKRERFALRTSKASGLPNGFGPRLVNPAPYVCQCASCKVEREGFELNAFHSGGRGVESIGGKEGGASDFVRLVAGIMRELVNQVGIFIQDFQLFAC